MEGSGRVSQGTGRMFVCSVWQAGALTSNNNAKAVTLRQQHCEQDNMSATSPRQSRRTAASRRRVVDSDDDMDMDVDMSDDVAHTETAHADEQDEDEEE